MTEHDVKKILEIGVLLSSEQDLNRLLEHILTSVMELARCDAGTLYLLQDGALHFRILRNNTLGAYSGGDGQIPDLPPVALTRESVCALAVLDSKTISIEDVRTCTEYDLTGPIRYDAITGYHTQSMLVVPMRSREGETIGVLQLINALDGAGQVCAFPQDMALVLESVASQAAITIQNVRYMEEIKELFQSFVRVMSAAIDERTPYNVSHSRHMAAYGARFVDFLNARAQGTPPISPACKRELMMSIWLHDVGKLVIPLEVMNKEARLLPAQRTAFTHRMEVIRLRARIDALSGRISPEQEAETVRQTEEAEALVQSVNAAGFLPDEKLAAVAALGAQTYTDEAGAHPWLTPDEQAMLSIRKGTLSNAEREVMESHVTVTGKLLSQIRFPKDLAHVPGWASAHHELLDGSGYPRHLTGPDIPFSVRIITILDVFDALVADDRPYKPGMPVERALSILQSMAEREGKLDPELTRLFVESKCWEPGESS